MMKLLRLLIEQRLKSAEAKFHTSLSCLRQIARTSLPHFLMFMTIIPVSRFRKVLKAEPYHIARIATARHEGCGFCLQLELALANEAGVGKAVTRAAAEGNSHRHPPELAEVYDFSEAVLRGLDTWLNIGNEAHDEPTRQDRPYVAIRRRLSGFRIVMVRPSNRMRPCSRKYPSVALTVSRLHPMRFAIS